MLLMQVQLQQIYAAETLPRNIQKQEVKMVHISQLVILPLEGLQVLDLCEMKEQGRHFKRPRSYCAVLRQPLEGKISTFKILR